MKKRNLIFALGAFLALTACTGGTSSIISKTSTSGTTSSGPTWLEQHPCDASFVGYESLSGRTRKNTYETLLSYMPGTLNYTKTMQSENATHIANFVDGLVEHDRFGNLVPCLATDTGTPNENYDEWTFTIKSGIPWVTCDGNIYQVNGENQYVKAADFKYILQVVLTSSTASESSYLPMLIIEGAEQYNAATAAYEAYKSLSEDARNRQIYNTLNKAGLADGISTSDIPSILNFERVGVTVDEETNTITYKLSQAADYFPTMLTYLPFLPLNQTYYQEYGSTLFGSERNILCCGAYLLKLRSGERLEYAKNPYYWDADSVKTENVIYRLMGSDISDDYARKLYEAGDIDGFTVSSKDTTGWNKYVRGEDGEGTITDPHYDYTYSQEGQGDKSSFMFFLNINREAKTTSYSPMTGKDITNANTAFKYSYFRNALFDALDLEAYNARNGAEVSEQRQYQINTYTPKYFVTDNSGKDYFDYLLEAYEEKHKCSLEEAEAALNPGQVNQISLEESVQQVKEALAQLEQDESDITYPIKVEYASLYGDTEQRQYDEIFMEYTNERLNGCIIDEQLSDPDNEAGLKVCSSSDIKVQVVPNTKISSSNNYIEVSNTYNYSLMISGWGPDYGDPMTYAHTMVKGGDLAVNIGIADDDTLSEETEEKLATYGEMVDEANAIVSTTNELKQQRYAAFAKAEIYLLEELALMKPLYQRGQGYSCSVSKFIPYRSPRSGYGLSGDKLKGLEIIDGDPLLACERQVLKNEWNEEKASQTTTQN